MNCIHKCPGSVPQSKPRSERRFPTDFYYRTPCLYCNDYQEDGPDRIRLLGKTVVQLTRKVEALSSVKRVMPSYPKEKVTYIINTNK